ncbi:hypothetical protein SAMN05720766_13213 [Fibrobacter sp. UWH9]|nr:hypothetical protein SAMN05720766_13213 [Fibrobacter sp. UWH9]
MYHISGSVDNRHMSADSNFVYDSEGNLIEDKSKNLKISYDWRDMLTEFLMEARTKNILDSRF